MAVTALLSSARTVSLRSSFLTRSLCLTSVLRNEDPVPDFYAVLGVGRAAELKDIKLAYYKLAKRYHPDNNRSDEARWMFLTIAEAYDVLSDPQKRKDYDEFGTVRKTMGGMAGGPERPKTDGDYDDEELFDKIFGEAGINTNRSGGFKMPEEEFGESNYGKEATQEYVANLTFEEAAVGCTLGIPIRLRIICPKCCGTRSEMGYHANICPYCEGTGIETVKVGHVTTRRSCSYCDGTRMFIKYKCIECEGTGQTIGTATYKITIPPGSSHGQVLKVPLNEELLEFTVRHHKFIYAYLQVEESAYFRRDGFDIHSEVDISLSQALLGGTVFIKGLYNDEMPVAITPGTKSHRTIVLHNEGIRHGSDTPERGDHIVHVGIKVPVRVGRKQRELLRKLSELDEEQIGVVDGVETPDGHRYRVNVIEASRVKRGFRESKAEKESAASQGKQGYFTMLREKLFN